MSNKRPPSDELQLLSKRQKLDTATDAAPSPDDGSEFNSKVLATCAKGGLADDIAALSGGQTFILLFAILHNDRNMQGLSEIPDIIHNHPELELQLQDAWKSKRFGEIRRLPFFQAPKAVSQVQADNDHQGCRVETVSESILGAWELPYRGQAHTLLYDSICEMRTPNAAPYQNIVTIIQSSGYGKTRMLDEHAKLVFTFPFIVRNPSETRLGSAYPHPDERVHQFLTSFGNTEEEAVTGYYRFFSHLFTHASSIIAESYDGDGSQSLPEWWRSYLGIRNNRQRLYSQAVDFAESSITTGLLTPSSSADMCLSSSQPEVQKGDNQPGLDVLNAVEGLLKGIPIPVSKNKAVEVAIYFDEAHELSAYHLGPKQRNRLEVLYSCLDVFAPFPLVFIFTSTRSSIHRLASPRIMARSSRKVIGNSVARAPVTELPFDCHYSFPLKPDIYSFEDICKLKFLANFGRPLFWSLLESGDNERHMLDLAMNKLAPVDSDLIYRNSDPIGLSPTYSMTAIIDLLLMLDYNTDRQTVQDLQKELIASHMRTCISIPRDREYIRSCYPSEPFLAEAAMAKLANMINPRPDVTYPDAVIDIVNAHFSQDLLHSGDRGQLAARMLLMSAYMSGCKNGGSGERVIYSNGCKLNDFLRCLFHQSDQVLEAKPDNVLGGPTLEDVFEDAVVRFTHFGKFIDDAATSQHAVHAAFLRCMAIICHAPESVNIIVPVLSTTKGVVCRHVITSILIQIKKSVRPSLLAIDESKLGFFPENTICKCGRQPRNTELKLPYISFVLDLGVRERRTYAMPIPTSTPGITPPKHNRYAIYVRGLSMFRSITLYNLGKYERLLRSSDVLGDHPHQSPSHLSMVQALKPFWAGGEAFAWIEDEALTGHPGRKEADTLEVGKYRDEHDT